MRTKDEIIVELFDMLEGINCTGALTMDEINLWIELEEDYYTQLETEEKE